MLRGSGSLGGANKRVAASECARPEKSLLILGIRDVGEKSGGVSPPLFFSVAPEAA